MSISARSGVLNVFVAGPDSSEINLGTSFGELEGLRHEVIATDPEFTELITALDETIAEPSLHEEIIKRRRAQGRFLLGISAGHGFYMEDLGGLLYAEGVPTNPDNSLSVVRMGTWIRQSTVPSHEQESTRKALVDGSLYDVKGGKQSGIPVNRLTVIRSLHPKIGEKPVVFGYQKELESVGKLEIPQPLKNLLLYTMGSWHRSELKRGRVDFRDVREDLQHVWFSDH
ncbi:MAG TPA: hypothetical protein VMR95_00875 [Candidatus Binatia bacterium]|nr:hypothetical protein [Candidatus Binatia bacterium]